MNTMTDNDAFYPRLFVDLCKRLTAAVPSLAWVDHDWGQDQTDEMPGLAYPAALIDFQETGYDEIGGLSQLGAVTVSVRIFFANYAQSSAFAPDESRRAAMECYHVERQVVKALHGWEPPDGYCQELIRTSEGSENRNDIGLRIRTVVFSTAFEDVVG